MGRNLNSLIGFGIAGALAFAIPNNSLAQTFNIENLPKIHFTDLPKFEYGEWENRDTPDFDQNIVKVDYVNRKTKQRAIIFYKISLKLDDGGGKVTYYVKGRKLAYALDLNKNGLVDIGELRAVDYTPRLAPDANSFSEDS